MYSQRKTKNEAKKASVVSPETKQASKQFSRYSVHQRRGAGPTPPNIPLNPLDPHFLQRALGNRAVGRMFQAKLKIGRPNDKFEQEADRVADQVMRMPEPIVRRRNDEEDEALQMKPFVQRQPVEEEQQALQTKPIAARITPILQRREDDEALRRQAVDEDEEKIQRQPVAEEDDLQRQAEKVDESVQTAPFVQRQAEEDEETTLQRKCTACQQGGAPCPNCAKNGKMQRKPLIPKIFPFLQRQADEDEKTLQGKSASTPTPAVTPKVSANINAMHGGGQPLPPSARAFFEPRFGADFSNVRIHRDSRAAETAQAVNAKAFTVGRDVAFGGGQFAPETSAGKKLLAHELTHVVQQESTESFWGIRRNVGDGNRSPEKHYNITIGEDKPVNATTEEAIRLLKGFYRRIHSSTEGGRFGHSDLQDVRQSQPIVGFISDFLADPLKGGIEIPPLTIWDKPRELLKNAKTALDNGEVETAVSALGNAERAYAEANKKFIDYREGTIKGAEYSVTGLKVTAAAGAVAATVASGGIAAGVAVPSLGITGGASLGLLGTSTAVGVSSGVYGATQELAGQTTEKVIGTRQRFDWGTIGRRFTADTVTNFIGSYAGGALAKQITKHFGSYLANASDDLLVQLGKDFDLKGSLPRDFFVTQGQKFFAEFIKNIGTAPLTVSVNAVIDRAAGGTGPVTIDEFAQQVIKDMVTGVGVQIFLSAFTRSKARFAGLGKTGAEGGKNTPPARSKIGKGAAKSRKSVPAESGLGEKMIKTEHKTGLAADVAAQSHKHKTKFRAGSGKVVESAHMVPTAAVQKLQGYSRSNALTVLLPKNVHKAFDNHWKKWVRIMRQQLRKQGLPGQVTVQEWEMALNRAAESVPELRGRTADTISFMIRTEFYQTLNLKPTDVLPLPKL